MVRAGRRPVVLTTTVVYLLAVAVITMTPQPTSAPGGPLLQLSRVLARREATGWITFGLLEFTANVIMFIPFGVLFCLLLGRRRRWLVLLLAAGSTVVIESAQLVIPNRVSDVRDLVANTAGAAIGLAMTLLVRRGTSVQDASSAL